MRRLLDNACSLTLILVVAACSSDAGESEIEAETDTADSATTATMTQKEAGRSAPSPAGSRAATPAGNAVAGTPARPARPAMPPSTPASAGASSMSAGAGSPAAGGGGASGAAPAAAGGPAAGEPADEPTGGDGVPCEVSRALANGCHRCHGPVPANGAPMSLVTLEDFQALSVGGKPRVPKYQVALARMNGSKSPPMPPATSPISDEDKQTLIDWLSEGAPAGDADSCL